MQIALMDCNNFYASCEKVFAPHLADRPVVVLSNNDGCIIARSREAKELGVPMGAPAFKCRQLFSRQQIAVFSSNYALYGDMSARVMATAGGLVPRMEVYSIDEAFLDITDMPAGAAETARMLCETVKRDTGITVSVGIGSTKTLAKAANRLAKKDPTSNGVFEFPEDAQREQYLSLLEISDIWGIGPRRAKRLKASGVRTALDFTRLPRDYVKEKFTITGLHTWLELRGVPCIPLGSAPKSKKAIVTSRSFGRPVTRLDDLREALSHYASRAAEKLRAQKGQAATILVWMQIYTGNAQQPLKGVLQSQALNPATSRSPEIVRAGMKALESIFIPGRRYKKLGVMLTGIENEGGVQLSLLREPDQRADRLMAVLDQVNAKWGRETLFAASSGVERPWRMRQGMRSPRYTTVWAELPVALA